MSERNPTKLNLRLLPEMVAKYKKYDCEFYEQCLDVAVSCNWSQFTCRSCTAYVQEKKPLNLSNLRIEVDDEEEF